MTFSNTSGSAETVLVILTTDCENTNSNDGCYMSYEASGGVTVTPALTNSVGSERDDAAGVPFVGSAIYAVTVSAGSSTVFTAEYAAGITSTATFTTSSIVIAK